MKISKIAAPLAAVLLLASCGTADKVKQIVTQEVDVPDPIHCNPDLGPEPTHPDDAAALRAVPHPDAADQLRLDPTNAKALQEQFENLGYQVKLLLSGRLVYQQRDAEKSAALEACKAKKS